MRWHLGFLGGLAQPNPAFQAQTSNCNISLKILPENLHKKNFPNNLKEDPWKAELILGLPRLLFTGIVGSREDSCVLGATPPQPVELRRALAGGLNGRDSRRHKEVGGGRGQPGQFPCMRLDKLVTTADLQMLNK